MDGQSPFGSPSQHTAPRRTAVQLQLGGLLDKISKTEKKSVLVDDLHLDSVIEAKNKKLLASADRNSEYMHGRKQKITAMVKEFFEFEDVEQLLRAK